MFICDRGTGAQQFRGLVMSKNHRRRPRRYKFEFSFVGNDRRPSQKSGTRRENRNAPDSPDLSPSIPDDRGYLRFLVFISWQNLGLLHHLHMHSRDYRDIRRTLNSTLGPLRPHTLHYSLYNTGIAKMWTDSGKISLYS